MALLFNEPVRLRVQKDTNWLAIIAEPDKGDPDEEEALQAVVQIADSLWDRVTRRMYRNTPDGDRLDHIVIV